MADVVVLSPGETDLHRIVDAIRQMQERFPVSEDASADGDKGDITVSASGSTWTIDNLVVTYAKMQNISATARILGRKTSGAGSTEECTLSEILDFVGSAANGDILYRTGGAWARLPIGSNTNVLTVASSLPSWAAAATVTQPTRQYLTSGTGATYTTPANCKKLIIKMIGAGGGGGAQATNNGNTGGTTTFDSIGAIGGSAGTNGGSGSGGAGGTGGSGSAALRLPGSGGHGNVEGGLGAPGIFGMGAPTYTAGAANGAAGGANTGAGGGGGHSTTIFGGGGGSGEYVEIVISSPAATYTYTIGAVGAGGAAGTQSGGNGGSGLIIVEEYY